MKIIQVIPEFGLAGAEIMCENLTYELTKLGHEVIIVSLFDYHSVITERLEEFEIDVYYLNKKPGLDISIIGKLAKLLVEKKPDVIHTHRHVMQYTVPASIIAGVKRKVHTVHSIAKKENNRIGRFFNKVFYKFFNVTPIALSDLIQDTIAEEYKIKKEAIPVILNGVDLSKCIPKTDYSKTGKFTILHIGRFMEPKNHIGLVKAFEIFHNDYPDSILQLIGDGNLKCEIEQYVTEHRLDDCVEFLGLKSDVHGYLHDADIFTLPSLYEGIPITLIEAMGTGLPIVATAVGGVPDMLRNNESAILTSTDPNKIANAFWTYANDSKLRRRYGQKAKENAKDFSAEKMSKKYIDVYERQDI